MIRASSVGDVCTHLDEHVEAILSEWLALTSTEPWTELSRAERIDDVRELIRGVVEASLCAAGELEVHRRKVEAAARHGERRRSQDFEAPLLFAGHHFLREAVRRHFEQCDFSPVLATDALLRIDIATTMATMASLRGFYRSEHEARGRWSDVIEEMARESLNLQPRH